MKRLERNSNPRNDEVFYQEFFTDKHHQPQFKTFYNTQADFNTVKNNEAVRQKNQELIDLQDHISHMNNGGARKRKSKRD